MIKNYGIEKSLENDNDTVGRMMEQSVTGSHRNRPGAKVRTPGVAAVLSALLPGLGQVYNGRFLWAIVWFVITPGLWIGSGGFLGWVCHIVSALQAYGYARKRMEM